MEPLESEDPQSVGPYRLTARLGAGGMGRVYLGEGSDGTRAAVKVIRPDWLTDPDFRKRFRREIDASRSVSGPWVARVLDADPDAPAPWLATEYVPGPTLAAAVHEHGPMPVPTLRRLAAALAVALRDLHASGLVHRDVKPNNILLAADGPRLIDFGIARSTDDSMLTATNAGHLGVAGYIPPERLIEGRTVPAGDVFALAAVLCYAATGRNAFGLDNPVAVAFRVAYEQPDLTGVPPELLTLIAAGLAKDPDQRPTAEQLVQMLLPSGELASAQATQWLPAGLVPQVGPSPKNLFRNNKG